MKKILFPIIAIFLLTACSKDEEVDPRESFTGKWNEVYEYTFTYPDGTQSETYSETGEITITKSSTSSDKIIINDSSASLEAVVSGNTFNVPEQMVTLYTPDGDMDFSVTGSGSLNKEGVLEFTYELNGSSMNVTMKGSATK